MRRENGTVWAKRPELKQQMVGNRDTEYRRDGHEVRAVRILWYLWWLGWNAVDG